MVNILIMVRVKKTKFREGMLKNNPFVRVTAKLKTVIVLKLFWKLFLSIANAVK